jgi:hypothetical protein
MGMFCETQRPKGGFRCAIEIQKSRPLGKSNFAAKVTRIILQPVSGPQQELKVSLGDGLYEHYGATHDEAEANPCAEFRQWAIAEGGSAS